MMQRAGILLTLSMLAVPACAEPLQIRGTTGYAGEYELSGSVSEQSLNGKRELAGPLTVRHVGLCTRDGPKETVGEIRLELSKSSSRITATLDFDGSKCTYKGVLSESYRGFMDCSREGSLPLRLWTK
jgi:hypothetical protein